LTLGVVIVSAVIRQTRSHPIPYHYSLSRLAARVLLGTVEEVKRDGTLVGEASRALQLPKAPVA
jgi:hypothetical protein